MNFLRVSNILNLIDILTEWIYIKKTKRPRWQKLGVIQYNVLVGTWAEWVSFPSKKRPPPKKTKQNEAKKINKQLKKKSRNTKNKTSK